MFAKFDEIPSLPVQVIKVKTNIADEELQRAMTLKELAPSPYFSIINVHLVEHNVFAKCYEYPSLPFQDNEKIKIKIKKHRGRINGRTDTPTDRRTT